MYESTKKAIQKYKSNKKTFSLLFSKIFFERIKKQAETDGVSISALITTAVSEYLDKRAAEMAQAKAQEKAQREQRKQEKEQAREEKKRAEQEAFRAAHAYDPTPDLPQPSRPVVVPEPLEAIDYRQRIAEQRQKEEEEQRQREVEEQRKREAEEQRKAFERMQKAETERARREAQERAQKEASRRSRPLPAQPTGGRARTVDLSEAVRPVDKQEEPPEIDVTPLLQLYIPD